MVNMMVVITFLMFDYSFPAFGFMQNARSVKLAN